MPSTQPERSLACTSTDGSAVRTAMAVSTSVGLDQHLIHVTPPPIFSRLERPDYRVSRRVKVFGCVLILRLIAATYVAAGEALAQVNPPVSCFQTLFTALGTRRYVFLYLVHVFAPFSPEHLHEPPIEHEASRSRRLRSDRATQQEKL